MWQRRMEENEGEREDVAKEVGEQRWRWEGRCGKRGWRKTKTRRPTTTATPTSSYNSNINIRQMRPA